MWSLIKCQVVIITAIILANYVNAQVDVGDLCNHKTKGIPGICKRLDECSNAIQDLKQGINPQHCGFVGITPIVCCIEANPTPPPTTTTITTTKTTTAKHTTSSTIKTPTGHLPVGEKSRQACQNYKIFQYIVPPPKIDELVVSCPIEIRNQEPEYSHMALIGYGSYLDKYEWKCVGSLISDKFVLTAAKCVDAAEIGEPQFVRLGDIDYVSSSDDKHVQQINVKNRIKHPLYKSPLWYHDIALLELERAATLNWYVKPICLYTLDPVGSEYISAIVIGWNLNEERKSASVLVSSGVRYYSTETCNLTYANYTNTLPRGVDNETQVCYGPFHYEKDTCQSDLGGPIQLYNRDVCTFYIFGITSFGRGCNHENILMGYVNLYRYIEWVEGIVWP